MEMIQQVSSVVGVFTLLGGTLWTLRRGGRAGGLRVLRKEKRALQSIERLPLTPQHSLHLVRIQGRELVVATHPQGCALLMEAPDGPKR